MRTVGRSGLACGHDWWNGPAKPESVRAPCGVMSGLEQRPEAWPKLRGSIVMTLAGRVKLGRARKGLATGWRATAFPPGSPIAMPV